MSALDFATPVDASPGSSWGDVTSGGSYGNGRGVSCTAACQADWGKECDGAAFGVDVTNQAEFDEASSMTCAGGSGLSNYDTLPAKLAYDHYGSNTNKCYYGTGGTCGGSHSGGIRVCPCKCGAGTYQPSTGIATACPR